MPGSFGLDRRPEDLPARSPYRRGCREAADPEEARLVTLRGVEAAQSIETRSEP